MTRGTSSPPPSWYEPPLDRWGYCPSCGCSQEDAERLWSTDTYKCPCGRRYTNDDANPDPQDMRDEMRMSEAGL